jgi:hypothetical protein
MSLLTPSGPEELVIQETQFASSDPQDPPGIWRAFVNYLRTKVGLDPPDLAKRYATAKVCKEEIDNQVKLLKVREEYELAMAEVERKRQEARDRSAIDAATA